MSTESNDQYRAGFEAHASSRGLTLIRARIGDGYYLADTNEAWKAWCAAIQQREASTEPSALVESLRAALRSVNAVAIERGDKFGACDQVDNNGQPYQSQWFADLLADGAAGALSDDAKDAARWRYIEEHATTHGGGNGFKITCFVPVDEEDIGCGIDAAIAAHTKAGSGNTNEKGEG